MDKLSNGNKMDIPNAKSHLAQILSSSPKEERCLIDLKKK